MNEFFFFRFLRNFSLFSSVVNKATERERQRRLSFAK